jgi:hypothetical protein
LTRASPHESAQETRAFLVMRASGRREAPPENDVSEGELSMLLTMPSRFSS